MLTTEDLPPWAGTVITFALGAGGAKLLAVWLENRRLTNRDYRETLEHRIRDLERQVAGLMERVGSLRVEVAHHEEALKDELARADRLEEENARLRARLLEVDFDRDPDIGG